MKNLLKGIPASPGISIGKVFLYQENKININKTNITKNEIENEILLLKSGKQKTIEQLVQLRESIFKKLGVEKAEIFDGHITLVDDEDLLDETIEKIEDDLIRAEYALELSINEYCEMLANLEDTYLRERATDLKDISKRWISNIKGLEFYDLSSLPKGSIVIAEDLTPSDTAQLNLDNVFGFVTEVGGKTAHSAIMARSLELPAIVGLKGILNSTKSGDNMILDGLSGEVIINPSETQINEFTQKMENFIKEKEDLKKLKTKKAITTDNVKFNLWANIGSPKDVESAIENGAEGIGLYRTEFLFMNSDKQPTEDDQFLAYKTVAEKMEGKPVTIRTMDIGGDKELSYMELPNEMNPFLGWRAIRISLDKVDIFKTQLKAILRASVFGQIKIMFPMVISVDEIREAKTILEECKKELKDINIDFDENIKVGIMVETPAVAFRANIFAKEVDFFSIGTNDLTQYCLAVDRGNERISNLYNSFNPSVLTAIKMAIDGAHQEGISISMCGEFAADERASKLLVGMGLDSFSMSASSVPRIKNNILGYNKKECQENMEKLLKLSTVKEVMNNL